MEKQNEKLDYKELVQSDVYLHFEDGTSFKGKVNRSSDDPDITEGVWGEAAFTTGMSGYQETITDPSFLGQHIIFSTAHIGNYSPDERANQSQTCHGTAVIARNISNNDFLNSLDVPLIYDLDCRSLVKYLVNTKNSHKSVINFNPKTPSKKEFSLGSLKCNDLNLVGQTRPETLIEGENPVVLINYGVKKSIVDNLVNMGFPLVTLPHDSTIEEIKRLRPRMIFLSNGPGDPRKNLPQIEVVRQMLELDVPVRGICMGHQLLTLALGGKIFRLPFGQRGVNHPCLNHVTGNIIITSQNHGYASDYESLKSIANSNKLNREIIIEYSSLFDQSVEGISTVDHFVKSVQFHPEANPGPSDAFLFFKEIENYLKGDKESIIDSSKLEPIVDLSKQPKIDIPYDKILLIGSGPIKIGQASEFDYSGTQACKSLKELGLDVILLNSNPATIMTDPEMSHRTYIEPITKDTIKKIIEKDKVDAILSTMGGQTALNICVELEEENYLKENNVTLLGAKVDTIRKTEDRDLFARELDKLGYQTGKRYHAKNEDEAVNLAASKVGYPLIIRQDYALGGKGAALVYNENELENVFNTDIKFPITMEKSLVGFKEIELEVMVDKEKNGVVICSIENIDPCGIHTGDSITVAPAQTISDRCYQQLRTISLTVAKHMGIVAGGANVQFAINPQDEDDIIVIEMNPRVSRSSALASKATGYPIAKISAMLAVGYTLKDVLNDITKASPVAFEPTLDYVAIKIPIFPFNKFPTSSKILGPQMRSVGEVLALGGSFNEAFLKALRSLEMGLEIPSLTQLKTVPVTVDESYIRQRMTMPYQLSLLTVLEGLRLGISAAEIMRLTKISSWFIEQMEIVKNYEDQITHEYKGKELEGDNFRELFTTCKKVGLSDKHLARLLDKSQVDILEYRQQVKCNPVFKAVDTCSGEFNAMTPYFYSTYASINEADRISNKDKSIVIMGSGPNRIGQGIEFDYSCVKSCMHLHNKKIKSIMLNSNPETVSTDYDTSDRLYMTPLFEEDVYDILCHEKPEGIITSFSGQTGIVIRDQLENNFRSKFAKFNFLGPEFKALEMTEDRKLFDIVTKEVDLARTKSKEVCGHNELVDAMCDIGLPVIIRPSYVIGGESMYIFHHHSDIEQLPRPLQIQLKKSSTTFQIENYIENAFEYDVDLIRDKFGNTVFTVCEHIEYAGVHSGDSGMISPPVRMTSKIYKKMKKISEALAEKLDIIGPINFQYAVKDQKVYCIEANPRGSRTLPFLSKANNISLPSVATDAMLGEEIKNWSKEKSKYFSVKQSTFPFDRFIQDNIILGPKMRSTGETLGIDRDKDHAIMKSYLGNYPKLNEVGKILLSLADYSKSALLPYLKPLHYMGFKFYATEGTCSYIKKQGISCTLVAKINEEEGISILDVLKDLELKMVFNTPHNQGKSKSDGESIRNNAIQYGVPCFTRSENIVAVVESIIGCQHEPIKPVSLQGLY